MTRLRPGQLPQDFTPAARTEAAGASHRITVATRIFSHGNCFEGTRNRRQP